MVEEFPGERVPVLEVVRIPVTNEDIVHACKNGFATDEEKDISFEMIKKFLFGIAKKFYMKDNIEELVQDAFHHIWSKIHTFDSSKGNFTTWSGWVARNFFIQLKEKVKKNREFCLQFDSCEDDEDSQDRIFEQKTDEELKISIKLKVLELFEKYPQHRHIFHALFGNPKDNNYSLPSTFCIQDAVNITGMSYNDVYQVTTNIIRPSFSEVC